MSRIDIYLNDHLAGAVAASQLARRAAGENRGNGYGEALGRLTEEIEADRQTLLAIMAMLDVDVDRLKTASAWVAEKLGRLKPNGAVIGYSALSRMVELDMLTLGVHGKLLLWEALAEIEPLRARLSEFDLELLMDRARSQLQTLKDQRLAAAADALA